MKSTEEKTFNLKISAEEN